MYDCFWKSLTICLLLYFKRYYNQFNIKHTMNLFVINKTRGSNEPLSLTYYLYLQLMHAIMQPLYFCFGFRDKSQKLVLSLISDTVRVGQFLLVKEAAVQPETQELHWKTVIWVWMKDNIYLLNNFDFVATSTKFWCSSKRK